jgi:hypothetical protein
LGVAIQTSAGIAFDGIATQATPTDLKSVPTFAIKIGVAIVGGLIAGKIADYVVNNVASVVSTLSDPPAATTSEDDLAKSSPEE